MRCYKCNVQVNSRTHICPLCKNELSDEWEELRIVGKEKQAENEQASQVKKILEEDVFPVIPTVHKGHGIFLKILALIFFISSVLCVVINLMINRRLTWSLIVVAATLCVAFSIAVAIKKRHHFARLAFSEYFLIVVGSILWDYFTGWHIWSLNFVLPLVNMVYVYICFVLRIFFPYQLKNYFMNLLLACTIGLVPVCLLVFEITDVKWTAYASAIASVIMLGILVVFDGKKIKKEWESRFHV